MTLSDKQINELHIGTTLATELLEDDGKRKFIHVYAYLRDDEGHKLPVEHRYMGIGALYYGVCVYSILTEVIENDLDVGETDIIYHCKVFDITSIEELEKQIMIHLADISLLLPSWYCDDIL